MESRNAPPGTAGANHRLDNGFESLVGRAGHGGLGPGEAADLWTDQRIGVQHKISRLDQAPAAQRQQLRITRPCPNEVNDSEFWVLNFGF
jgi:hypothetical protein